MALSDMLAIPRKSLDLDNAGKLRHGPFTPKEPFGPRILRRTSNAVQRLSCDHSATAGRKLLTSFECIEISDGPRSRSNSWKLAIARVNLEVPCFISLTSTPLIPGR